MDQFFDWKCVVIEWIVLNEVFVCVGVCCCCVYIVCFEYCNNCFYVGVGELVDGDFDLFQFVKNFEVCKVVCVIVVEDQID